ncbi:serine hydrolase domain-containing protein [Virgibacillus oceani]
MFLLCYSFFPIPLFADENTTPSGIPLTELEDFLDDYSEDYIGKTVPGASIVVVKDDSIILSKGYGYADMEAQIPMDASTSVLEWGSITKLFVWVAVMQLAEQDRIDLNEDIRTYLPEGFLTKLNYDYPISMLNLMNHNAGFEENIHDLLYNSPEHLTILEEALKLTEPEQVYKPGEVVAYSNYATSLAAFIIEQITGQEFYDYVSDNIFSKLGMNHSTIHLPVEDNEEIRQNKTKGYILDEPTKFRESDPFYISLYPSGGINGTAVDLAKFATALMPANDETSPLLRADKTLSELLSSSYSVHEGVPGVAHGFWEYDGQYKGLTHSGSTGAFSSNFHIVPEDNFAVIVLTNQADEIDLSFDLIHELVGDGDKTVEEKLPNSSVTEGSYLTARSMHSGFMNLYYYYLIPLNIKSINDNEIEVSVSGLTANYVQTSPYVYKMTSGHNAFIPNNVMYFQVTDGAVEQISTSYSDYLPMEKSKAFLYITMGLFIWCAVYFLISPFVLMVRAFLTWRRKKKMASITKWNWLLNLSGAAIVLNVFVLAIRMLMNPTRSYSELLFHSVLNYIFTATSLVFLVMIIVTWKKSRLSKVQKFGHLLSVVSSIILIVWLVIWQLYS